MKKETIFNFTLVFFVALFFSITLTWPLLKNLNLYFDETSDTTYGAWSLWHTAQALIKGTIFSSAYYTGNQLYPFPYSFAYSENMLLPALLFFTPIFLITKSVTTANNIFLILSLALTFTCAYYCFYYFTKHKVASLFGAFVFTFNPHMFSHFPHHAVLLNRYFIPLLFISVTVFIKKPSIIHSLIVWLLLCANILSSLYLGVMTSVALMLYAFVLLLFRFGNETKKYFLKILYIFVPLLFIIPALFFILRPYVLLAKNENSSRFINNNLQKSFYAARIRDWLSHDPRSFMFGASKETLSKTRQPLENDGSFNFSEHTLGLSIVSVLLSGMGIYYLYRLWRQKKMHPAIFTGMGVVMVITALLTFGPLFTGWNSSVPISTIVMPYSIMEAILPFTSFIRAVTRFQLIFYVPFSFFVAYGIVFLCNRIQNRKVLSIILFVITVPLLFENLHTFQFNARAEAFTTPTTTHELKNRITLHYPRALPGFEYNELRYVNWAIRSNEIIMNGYSAFIPPLASEYTKRMIKNPVDRDLLIELAQIGIEMLVVHKDSMNKKDLQSIQESKFLKPLLTINTQSVQLYDLRKIKKGKRCEQMPPVRGEITFTKTMSEQPIAFTINLTHDEKCYIKNLYNKHWEETIVRIGDREVHTTIHLPLIMNGGKSYNIQEELRSMNLTPGYYKGVFTLSRLGIIIPVSFAVH